MGQAEGARQGSLRQATVHAYNNKALTNLDSILKSRDVTFLTKVRIVKAVVFQ